MYVDYMRTVTLCAVLFQPADNTNEVTLLPLYICHLVLESVEFNGRRGLEIVLCGDLSLQ